MTATYGNLVLHSDGDLAKTFFTMTGDAVYPAGGYAVTPALLKLGQIQKIDLLPASGVNGRWNPSTGKIQFFPSVGSAALTPTARVPAVYAQPAIKGADSADSPTVDQAAAPTNGVLLKSEDTFTNYAGAITGIADTDCQRNVCITIHNDTGGPLDLFEGTTTFLVTGTYNGVPQTDAIAFTSTALNKTIAAGQFRFMYGARAFDTIADIAYDNAPAGALKAGVGVGVILGVPYPFGTAIEFLKISKNGATFTPVGVPVSDGTFVRIFFDNALTDGDNFSMTLMTDSATTATIEPVISTAEVVPGTDCSAVVLQGIAYGG